MGKKNTLIKNKFGAVNSSKFRSVPLLPRGKKGMELALNTVVIMIIAIIVLVIVIMYFVTHYGGNVDQITTIGQGTLDSIKDVK